MQHAALRHRRLHRCITERVDFLGGLHQEQELRRRHYVALTKAPPPGSPPPQAEDIPPKRQVGWLLVGWLLVGRLVRLVRQPFLVMLLRIDIDIAVQVHLHRRRPGELMTKILRFCQSQLWVIIQLP